MSFGEDYNSPRGPRGPRGDEGERGPKGERGDAAGLDLNEREVQLVTLATKRATQEIISKNRHRLLGWGAAIGAAIACAVSIPTTAVIVHENDHNARRAEHRAEVHNARLNCANLTALATAQTERIEENKQGAERFKRESADRLGLSPERFDELIKEGREKEERQLRAYSAVAEINCEQAIR